MTSTTATTQRRVVLFDLDNTLYTFAATGIAPLLLDNIRDVVHRALSPAGGTRDEALAIEADYYKRYGIAAKGLVDHHGCDAVETCRDIHDIDVDACIPIPDPSIAEMLAAVVADGWEIWVFTNGELHYALRVLTALGVKEMFRRPAHEEDDHVAHPGEVTGQATCEYRVIDCFTQWHGTAPETCNKPHDAAFVAAAVLANADAAGCEHPEKPLIVMVEDSIANLRAPAALGWTPVWVGHGATPPSTEHEFHHLEAITGLPALLRELHGTAAPAAAVASPKKRSREESATAPASQ